MFTTLFIFSLVLLLNMNQVSEWAKNQYDEARQKDAALANIDMYIE